MARSGGRAAVEVQGGPQLRRAFRRMGDRAGDLAEVHDDAARIVEDEAESLVPVLSGRLRETIRRSKRKTGASVLAGRSLVPYAGPIHFGWRARNIEPQPFLYDALDRRRTEVASRYAEGVESLVRRFDAEAPD
jgi:hypothetical protein